ncbi:hypothetical protein LZ32DRAFT_427116 [Colletotrichum eremochloae]|nr:hypothetical protein LZ32DRAFT_427116 [Colletotrichum eremochloae]
MLGWSTAKQRMPCTTAQAPCMPNPMPCNSLNLPLPASQHRTLVAHDCCCCCCYIAPPVPLRAPMSRTPSRSLVCLSRWVGAGREVIFVSPRRGRSRRSTPGQTFAASQQPRLSKQSHSDRQAQHVVSEPFLYDATKDARKRTRHANPAAAAG